MDVRLPVVGGMEAARQIRLLEGGGEVKIVALTASAFSQQREEVLAAGMDDFLRKPYRREEIFECMARQLGVRYTYRQVEAARSPGPVPAMREFGMLPQQLRQELGDAVIRLDPGLIGKVIERIAEYDPQLATAVGRAAKRTAYSEILKALKDSNVHSRD